ncbi:hypothetical protein ACFSKU_14170 [Pontibacter silvestris]|uniref:Uncharacterized protein n=1 Tax=Pontibacter silvestris TaxID=2305183 RepID=A0ABW4X0I1_9BACT|nr:hypothetical protein [Pontibacter silvestris]MCC9138204.1 hypothetical protein [Pontibacter silvestris]
MMLEYSMFRKLPTWSQAEVVTKRGTLLAERKQEEWSVLLYSFNNFFVELWVKDHLKITTTFQKTASTIAIVEPYMDGIDLDDFMEF